MLYRSKRVLGLAKAAGIEREINDLLLVNSRCLVSKLVLCGIIMAFSPLSGCHSGAGDTKPSHSEEAIKEGERELRTLKHNYGPILAGDQVDWVFPIVNTSSAPWTPTQSVADCSCSVLNLPKRPIAPGDTVEVTFSFRGSAEPGTVTRTATIFFDQKQAPIIKLELTANVKSQLEVIPTDATINPMINNMLTLMLENYGKPINGLRASSRAPWMNVTIEEIGAGVAEAKQAWRLHVSVDKDLAEQGVHPGRIDFSNKDQIVIGHTIVKCVNKSKVVAVPSRVFFGEVSAGEAHEQSILVKFDQDQAPRSSEEIRILTDHEGLRFTWRLVSPGVWKLTVGYKPQSVSDRLDDLIRIGPRFGEDWTLTIPVKSVVVSSNARSKTR